MECAGRALSFWAYQATQEMFDNQAMTRSSLADDAAVPTTNTWRRT